jgi:hypothetical protein
VRQFVDQRRVLHQVRPGIDQEQLLLAEIVKRGRLLAQEFYGGLLEIEVLRYETELLERGFLGADLLGLHNLLDALGEEGLHLALGNAVIGDGAELLETRDAGELHHDLVDGFEGRVGFRLRGLCVQQERRGRSQQGGQNQLFRECQPTG